MVVIIWSALLLGQASVIATPSADTARRAAAIARIERDASTSALRAKANQRSDPKSLGYSTPDRNIAGHRDMQRATAKMGLSSTITPLRYTYPGCSRVATSPWGSESGPKTLNGLDETFQCNTFVYNVSRLDLSKLVHTDAATRTEGFMTAGFPAADIQGWIKGHPLTWRSSAVEGGYFFASTEWVGNKETIVVSVTVPSTAASLAKTNARTILTAIVSELGY